MIDMAMALNASGRTTIRPDVCFVCPNGFLKYNEARDGSDNR
jgi:hypothetical protein